MTTFDSQLLLHLRLDSLPGGRVQDSSSHARHGTVTGSPAVVPDERFGSSVRFAGTDTVEIPEVTPGAGGKNPVHSIAGWIRLDAYPAKRSWLLAMGQTGAGAHHWLVNPDGRAQVGVWSGGQAAPPLPLGTWVHVTATFDGTALRCYLDGKLWDKAVPAAFNYTAWGFGVAAPRQPEPGYAGRLAGVRVYERALSAEDIRQVIEEDQSALAAFRRSHPLAFSLHDKDDQPVLAIVDDPAGNTMTLEVTNTASQSVVLGQLEPDTSHLDLRFRPGTLPADWLSRISVSTPDGWTARVAPATDGTVSVALTGRPGTQFAPGRPLTFILRDIGADGRGGTRGTRVKLRYTGMSYMDETSAMHGGRTQHLSIVNRRGQQHIPLEIGFVGFNTILSDNQSTNVLRLRVANVSRKPIPLTPSGRDAASAFIVSFDTGDPSSPWAMGTVGQLKSIAVKAAGWVAAAPTEQGKTLTWRLTTPTLIALAPGADLLIDIGGLIGRPPSGHSTLYLHYENIPGYWDGHLAVTVEKGPLVCRDVSLSATAVDARVGIGTATPQAKLHVAGGAIMPSAGNTAAAGIQFPTDPGGADDTAWIRYYPRVGEATTLEIGVANDADDHIALMPSGGVGVNITAPEARLHIVHTNQDGNGNAVIIGPTGQANLRLGYHANYAWVQSHGGKPLALNPVGSRVGIGTVAPDAMLEVVRGDAPGGTAMFRGTDRISHFNWSSGEDTYIRGGKTTSNVYLNDSGGNVAIGSGDPQGHRLLVNGTTKVLGLKVNSGTEFRRVQAGHFHAGPHSGGVKEVRINFPERFGSLPQAVVTARSEGYYTDTFAVTVKYIDPTHFKVNLLRLDAMNGAWQQNLRLDWIAWE